jgi:hypothetical protein
MGVPSSLLALVVEEAGFAGISPLLRASKTWELGERILHPL